MHAVSIPRDTSWLNQLGLGFLQFVYDWDTIVLPSNLTVIVSSPLVLCVENLPCSIQLNGVGPSNMQIVGDGQIVCLASAGCSSIYVRSVAFRCRNNYKSTFKIQGSVLILSGSSFTDCNSDSDGGAIQAYDAALVTIETCNFTNIHSRGFGGAVAAHGSSLSITKSRLLNCTSKNGGGAVWSSAFQDCYGSDRLKNTQLDISLSVFVQCRTGRVSAPNLVLDWD